MSTAVCTTTWHMEDSWHYDSYCKNGGYQMWRRVLDGSLSASEIIETVKQSGLRGRGGAGFPTGLKWSFMPRHHEGQKYLLCNSDESEPGTCKDREILCRNPHAVVEGMALAAFAVGATVSYNYLRGEFIRQPFIRFSQALEQARANGLLGQNIQGCGITLEIHPVLGAGAYICGEETALIESLEGKKGQPRFKPPFPAQNGLYGCPTTINNTETLASVPTILRRGAQWFSELGVARSGGVKLFSVSGHVKRPGNYELPLGIPFSELLEKAGGMLTDRPLKAVIPGGSSVPVMRAEAIMAADMDYESIAAAGSMLGSGAVIVMDDSTDMVRILHRISRFYMAESCGQCSPCREGTGWIYRILSKLIAGSGHTSDLDTLEHIAARMGGTTICAFGDAAAMPVESFLRHFRAEFEGYIKAAPKTLHG